MGKIQDTLDWFAEKVGNAKERTKESSKAALESMNPAKIAESAFGGGRSSW